MLDGIAPDGSGSSRPLDVEGTLALLRSALQPK